MAKHVIRNYGSTRNIPVGSGFVFLCRDKAIETDDDAVAAACQNAPMVEVTTKRNVSKTAPPISEIPEGGEGETPDLDKMTVKELKAFAAKNELEIPDGVKLKADILEFIKENQ